MNDMIHAFQSCVESWDGVPIKAFEVKQVFDVSGWIGGYLNALTNHSHPHSFKIQKVDGITRLFTKNLSTDKVKTLIVTMVQFQKANTIMQLNMLKLMICVSYKVNGPIFIYQIYLVISNQFIQDILETLYIFCIVMVADME